MPETRIILPLDPVVNGYRAMDDPRARSAPPGLARLGAPGATAGGAFDAFPGRRPAPFGRTGQAANGRGGRSRVESVDMAAGIVVLGRAEQHEARVGHELQRGPPTQARTALRVKGPFPAAIVAA